MTDEEVAEFFERWSDAGDEVREGWLVEFEQSLRVADWESVRILLAEQDPDLAERMVGGAKWLAEAPRRNARKPRRKSEWQRELVAHFRREVPGSKFNELARQVDGLPIYGQAEEPLTLCNGTFEIWRDTDDRIVCVHEDQRHVSIARPTLDRYLKEKPQAK